MPAILQLAILQGYYSKIPKILGGSKGGIVEKGSYKLFWGQNKQTKISWADKAGRGRGKHLLQSHAKTMLGPSDPWSGNTESNTFFSGDQGSKHHWPFPYRLNALKIQPCLSPNLS